MPDGTTAHVRCPACKTVFAAAAGLAPVLPVPVPPPPPASPRTPPPRIATRPSDEDRPRRSFRKDEDDADRPRKRPQREEPFDDEEQDDDRRDGIGGDDHKPRKRRRISDERYTEEERRQLRAQFNRAYYAARLIQISIYCYIPAVIILPFYEVYTYLTKTSAPAMLVVAGFLGVFNWLLGGIGIVLSLTGPRLPGHLRFGVAALVTSIVHALFLFIVILNTKGYSDYRDLDRSTAVWANIATQYDSLSLYLAYIVFPDEIPVRRADTILSFVTGVLEVTRLVLILVMLGCLAEAGGDVELYRRCNRMAGRVAIIPAILAIAMLLYKTAVVETRLGETGFGAMMIRYLYKAVDLAVCAILGMTVSTVADVVDVCESPYQSDIELGSVGY